MKKIAFSLAVLLFTHSSPLAIAEDSAEDSKTDVALASDKYFDQLRAEFRRNKAALVGFQMDLPPSELEIFWKVYAEYERELVVLNDKRIKTIEDYMAAYEKMDSKSASSLLTQYFANQRSRISLIEKYSGKLSRLISPEVALRFVHVETQINLVVDTELASQLPLAKKGFAAAE